MTGPEHWKEADLILAEDPCEYGCPTLAASTKCGRSPAPRCTRPWPSLRHT